MIKNWQLIIILFFLSACGGGDGSNAANGNGGAGGNGGSGSSFLLPDTGQNQSYTSLFGEDSDYSINPPDYSDNGNGTITDNNTNLTWQKESALMTMNLSDVTDYCDDLSLADYTDWRIPTVKELFYILDFSVFMPSIDETFFENNSPSNFWSSIDDINSLNYQWSMYVDTVIVGINNDSELNKIRCVRGKSLPLPSFKDNGDDTITDSSTGLLWHKQISGSLEWEDAVQYCQDLSLAFYNDWRLPNVKELLTLIDYDKFGPAIDTNYFPFAYVDLYWSSTTSSGDISRAYCVNFNNGYIAYYNKTNRYYKRCVRNI